MEIPDYGVALDQEEPSYLDRSEWQKQFHLRLAKTIATIIVSEAQRTSRKYPKLFRMLNQPSGAAIRR